MAEADATPILWGPLFEGLVLVEDIYRSRVVAESDLRGFLRDGRVPWRGERRGGRESDLTSGDRDVWRRESADVDLRIVWRENRLVRTVRTRTFPRAGERAFRPAPRQFHFVQIEIDMGRLRALFPGEEPSRDARKNLGGSPETPQKKRRGPKKGAIDRYAKSDRALFPVIRKRMEDGATLNAAVKGLGVKLSGDGVEESKMTRIIKRFSKENGEG